MIEQTFVGTIDQQAAHNVFALPELPNTPGIPLGIELTSERPFMFNPFRAMRDGLIDGLVVRIIGSRNVGKTSLAKMIGIRYGALCLPDGGRFRISADDTRRNDGVPEYKIFANALGTDEVSLSDYTINFLDPKMGITLSERMELCVMMLEHAGDSPLTDYELLALQVALWRLDRIAREQASPYLLAKILSCLNGALLAGYERNLMDKSFKNLPSELVRQLAPNAARSVINEADFIAASGRVYARLLILLGDKYSHMFGDGTSLAEVLSRPAVVLDYTRISASALTLVRAMVWRYRNWAAARGDRRFKTHVQIHDEDYAAWTDLFYARNQYKSVKQSRASGDLIVMLHHRYGDNYAVGSADSEQRALAVNALSETDILFAGEQSVAEAARLQAIYGFSDTIRDTMPRLRPRQFYCFIGKQQPVLFESKLTPGKDSLELRASASNQALDRMVV